MKESVSGWFKLLAQEEGEFYSVPVPSEEGSRIPIKPTSGLVGQKLDFSSIRILSFRNLFLSEKLAIVLIQ